MLDFYTPPKILENLWFPDVFRGYRNGTLGYNGLIRRSKKMHKKTVTEQKMKLFNKDFLSKHDHIRRKLRIRSDLQTKFLMENFIFCAVGIFATCPDNPGVG